MKKVVKRIANSLYTQYTRYGFYKRDKWMIKELDLPELSKQEIIETNKVWTFTSLKDIDLIWLRAYKKEHGFSPYFITDYSLRYILKHTNPTKQVISLGNKAMFDVYFQDIPFPNNYIKSIGGVLWANNSVIGKGGFVGGGYLIDNQIDRFIIKPSVDTGCGKGVKLVDLENTRDKRAFLSDLLNSYGKDYVVQEVITQHPLVKSLNPSSINCCRVTTMLFDGSFDYSTILKFGKKHSYLDNWNSSYLAGVTKDGIVNDVAFDNKFTKVKQSDSGVSFGGLKLPCFDEMITKLKQWHYKYFPQIGIVGWDVLIDNSNNILVIEVNLDSPGVVGEQFCSGTFFKNHRDYLNSL